MDNISATTVFFLYGLVKFIAYSTWCYATLHWFDNKVNNKFATATLLGLIRLLLGMLLGLPLSLLAFYLSLQLKSIIIPYLMIYPAVRVFEWGILWFMMKYRKIGIKTPNKKAVILWILGGIIVSCLADIPLFIANWLSGLPFNGRIFC